MINNTWNDVISYGQLPDGAAETARQILKKSIDHVNWLGMESGSISGIKFHYDHCDRQTKPAIKKVIYNNPATIILWNDGSKTVVKVSENDTWDPEKGFLMAFMTKILGKQKRNKLIKEWVKPQEKLEQEECMLNFWLHSDEFIERAKDLASHLSEVFKDFKKGEEE